MEGDARLLTIEIRTLEGVITGRLIDARGAATRFDGWLGLASVLQRALEPTNDDATPPDGAHHIDGAFLGRPMELGETADGARREEAAP